MGVANPRIAGEGLTGGSNGIPGVDPLNFFGYKLHSTTQYYFCLLIVFVLAAAALYFLNESRTGRSWRALREDPLAAEAMSIPVFRLKILAVVFGAGMAAGTRRLHLRRHPDRSGGRELRRLTPDHPVRDHHPRRPRQHRRRNPHRGGRHQRDLPVPPRRKNDIPELKRWLFYGVIVLIVARIRPWTKVTAVILGTIAFGFVAYAVAGAIDSSWTAGSAVDAGSAATGIEHWVIIPQGHPGFDTWAYVFLVAAIVVCSQLKGWWRTVVLIPTLYWVAVVWENVLAENPAVTALILFGALLIALMQARPQGLWARRGWRSSDGGAPARARGRLQGLRRPARDRRARPRRERAGGRERHRPERRRQDDALQPHHRLYQPDGGEIRLDGRNLVGMPPHKITELGIARTFQTLRLFLNMSVKENVMAAQYGRTKGRAAPLDISATPGMRREEKEIHKQAEEKLSFFGKRLMGYRWDQPAYSLSYANRRRLEIARAMATEPRILLLDEPAAGMNPVETQEITELIAQLRDEGGYTILVIEHDMHVVEGISDRVAALDHGVKIAEGSFEQVATDRAWSRPTSGSRARRR